MRCFNFRYLFYVYWKGCKSCYSDGLDLYASKQFTTLCLFLACIILSWLLQPLSQKLLPFTGSTHWFAAAAVTVEHWPLIPPQWDWHVIPIESPYVHSPFWQHLPWIACSGAGRGSPDNFHAEVDNPSVFPGVVSVCGKKRRNDRKMLSQSLCRWEKCFIAWEPEKSRNAGERDKLCHVTTSGDPLDWVFFVED